MNILVPHFLEGSSRIPTSQNMNLRLADVKWFAQGGEIWISEVCLQATLITIEIIPQGPQQPYEF